MSKKELDMSAFEEIGISTGASMRDIVYGLANGDCDFLWRTDLSKDLLEEQFGYEHIESEGGGEGEGEYCYGVFKLKDKIYHASWSYYSYNGCEYDYIVSTLCEVVPKEVMKTIYVNA